MINFWHTQQQPRTCFTQAAKGVCLIRDTDSV